MIRPAQFEDLQALIPLTKAEFDECLGGSGFEWREEEIKDSLIEFSMTDDHVLLVARVGEKVVGYLGGVITPWMHNKRQMLAIETGWYVIPEYRGRTVGIRLWRAWEKWVVLHNASLIYCASPQANPTVGFMLVKMGYIPLETYYVKEP